MSTPETHKLQSVRRLTLVEDTAIDLRSPFQRYADSFTAHPSAYPVDELDQDKLYGGVLMATETTQLRAIINALSLPGLQNSSPAQSVRDFETYSKKVYTVKKGVTRKVSDATEDPDIINTYLLAHPLNSRYKSVAGAIIQLEHIEHRRHDDDKKILGPARVLRLGTLALFTVDEDTFTRDFRDAMKQPS